MSAPPGAVRHRVERGHAGRHRRPCRNRNCFKGASAMPVQPYLFFDGRCEEAVNFYRSALGAEVEMLMPFKDAPEPPPGEQQSGDQQMGCAPSPAPSDKVMHASLRIGGTTVRTPAGTCQGKPSFTGYSLYRKRHT